MNVFEKIIEKLEELQQINIEAGERVNNLKDKAVFTNVANAYTNAIAITRKAAEEFVSDINTGNNHWIYFEKEFPQTDKDVLVQFDDGSMAVGCLKEINYEEYQWYICTDKNYCCDTLEEVIAWQPLPKPYQPQVEPETSKELKIKLEDVLQIIINNLETEKMKSYLNIDKLMEELLRKAKETSHG